MKHLKNFSSLFLILAITVSFITPASAHSHPDDTIPPVPTVSPWAQEEVDRARELGLVPNMMFESYRSIEAVLLNDYSVPITREQYIRVAMEFVALQQHCDSESLSGLVSRYLAEKSADGYFIKNVFSDDTGYASIAYYLGIVEGRGDGTFDPGGLITRQEAAVMLTRAYSVCGGTLPKETPETSGFIDENKIADWAKESASALASWNVMNGMEDGSFSPDEYFTVEQCIVTFLRLYENAPVSRKNGNVTPLFTYKQGIEYATKSSNIAEVNFKVDGPSATFIRLNYGGRLQAGSSLCFVYRDGGVRWLDPGICDKPWGFTPSQELENPHFSDDGNTFYFTMTLKEDVISYMDNPKGILIHEKGIYNINIDVVSGRYQIQRENLPE